MKLFVYKGEFGLPSIDFECLRVLTYFKLTDLNVEIDYSCSPFHSDTGFLPYLIDEDRKYCGYDKIISHLQKEKGYTLITSAPQLSYLSENLYPFFMYQLFGNPQNVDDTRALYAMRTPFPFNFYYPGKYIRRTGEVCQAVSTFSLEDPIDQHDTAEMNFKAKKCLNWISEKLGNNEFFLNGVPSEIDATIYAYLAVIIRYQLPNNQLQAHAKQCENLVRYVNNITKKCFKDSELFESPKAKEKTKKQEQNVFTGEEDEDPPSVVRRRYILSGLVATTAMISYAFLSGIFSISLADHAVDSFSFDDTNMKDDDE
ncbi:CLUMA_CG005287, isoform A [Clunio marinus]|uniref:CLUMA_CG005287, isoform A n=1 Tax=Clunio marinus TaxID=568069 RepID=A0A1J1HUF6_9DIPT|nr:CLUMA_CG005287, isoform A [Clunio marinus]